MPTEYCNSGRLRPFPCLQPLAEQYHCHGWSPLGHLNTRRTAHELSRVKFRDNIAATTRKGGSMHGTYNGSFTSGNILVMSCDTTVQCVSPCRPHLYRCFAPCSTPYIPHSPASRRVSFLASSWPKAQNMVPGSLWRALGPTRRPSLLLLHPSRSRTGDARSAQVRWYVRNNK